jgi:hypothetical protein
MYNTYIFYKNYYYFSIIKTISPWEKGIMFFQGTISFGEKGIEFPQGEKDYVPLAREQVSECLSHNYKG